MGRRFGDLVLSCEQGAPIGIRYAEGTVDLNPPDGHVVAPGDVLIVISANSDASTSAPSRQAPSFPLHASGQAPCGRAGC